MDAFTAIFTPFVASASEPTTAPQDEAAKRASQLAFFCVIA
jgi:hypothetical protein